jgi:hypothetical protein
VENEKYVSPAIKFLIFVIYLIDYISPTTISISGCGVCWPKILKETGSTDMW